MSAMRPVNNPPTRTPLVEMRRGPSAGPEEHIATKEFGAWLQDVADAVNRVQSGGGTGGGFMSGQMVTSPGQVISLPFAVPQAGARGLLILTQDATGGNTITWDPLQFGAFESTNINLNADGETVYDLYTQDKGLGAGVLWYLANQPFLKYL